MNIIHSVANFCLERRWLEAGGSTESVITATAALRSSTTPTNNRRSFQSLSALLPALWCTIEHSSGIVKAMHQMRKYRKLVCCNTIKYDGIGRLSGVRARHLACAERGSTAACATHLLRRKNRQRGGCKKGVRGAKLEITLNEWIRRGWFPLKRVSPLFCCIREGGEFSG